MYVLFILMLCTNKALHRSYRHIFYVYNWFNWQFFDVNDSSLKPNVCPFLSDHDINDHKLICLKKFQVKAVPAVIAIKNGLIVDKFIGLVDADMITNLIDKMSGKKQEEGV